VQQLSKILKNYPPISESVNSFSNQLVVFPIEFNHIDHAGSAGERCLWLLLAHHRCDSAVGSVRPRPRSKVTFREASFGTRDTAPLDGDLGVFILGWLVGRRTRADFIRVVSLVLP